MGWEEEEKNKEEAMGYGTFAASQPYPQPYGAGFPQPVPPPGIGGINPFAAAGVYPPAPAGVPPTGAASSAIYPPVHSLHPTAFPYYTQGYQTNPSITPSLSLHVCLCVVCFFRAFILLINAPDPILSKMSVVVVIAYDDFCWI
ncbi:hypothetical protein AXF42_Ash004188 [Apostasia shenzhenica]|uniref:Uncharacterized protein n=1 Tax=Apostasia shenzhenica TaxID=1088818 RepID=A0A2I0A294_9ASPA|nr:hypothetical protein AXF42_Ash004188 [Apostasia shenzhenica]